MTEKSVEVSVFTCTYNRIDTLRRTFDSLKEQTYRNFEWVLVDNGSTDGTFEAVQTWLSEVDFPVTLHRREVNSGFQNTYNDGIARCRGKFFLNLDSDDTCVPNAIERLMELWHSIPLEEQQKFVGVTVCCEDQHGDLVGNKFPKDPLDSNSLEVELRYRVKGEKWGVLRLDVLRQFPFPASEYHINPSIVWRAIARKYQTRYTNDILRIYYINEGRREDQITFHITDRDASYGKWLNAKSLLNDHADWFLKAPDIYLKNAMNYCRNASLMGISGTQQISDLKPFTSKVLAFLSLPYGLLWARFINKKISSLSVQES